MRTRRFIRPKKIKGGLPTEFAPAERRSKAELKRQMKDVSEHLITKPPVKKLLDSVLEGVVILNSDRQIVFANEAMLKTLGIKKADEVFGLRPGEALKCTHAKENRGGCGTSKFCRTCGAVHGILTALKGKKAVEECHITMGGKGGSVDLRVFTTPLSIRDERYTVFAVMDISHEKRRKSMEHIFFHDVLNTAGIVWNLAEFLQEVDGERSKDIAHKIYSATYRLINEINSQRELAYAENGELVVMPQPLRALSLLQTVGGMYRDHAVSKGKFVVIEPESVDVPLVTDRVVIERVLGNLIKNALEASLPGESVVVGCRPKGSGGVRFWVHNSEVMPEEAKLQVFKRYFTTKGKGRGLGTYSVKLLTEQYLGGRVSFESEQGRGTTFFIDCPKKL